MLEVSSSIVMFLNETYEWLGANSKWVLECQAGKLGRKYIDWEQIVKTLLRKACNVVASNCDGGMSLFKNKH